MRYLVNDFLAVQNDDEFLIRAHLVFIQGVAVKCEQDLEEVSSGRNFRHVCLAVRRFPRLLEVTYDCEIAGLCYLYRVADDNSIDTCDLRSYGVSKSRCHSGVNICVNGVDDFDTINPECPDVVVIEIGVRITVRQTLEIGLDDHLPIEVHRAAHRGRARYLRSGDGRCCREAARPQDEELVIVDDRIVGRA